MGERWTVRVLDGPRLERNEQPVRLPATAARVLGCLVLHQGETVPADDLLDGVWGHTPPSTARKSLQNQIVRLRAILGPDAITTAGAGYRLEAGTTTSDVAEFASLEEVAMSSQVEPAAALDAATRAHALSAGAHDPCFGWPSEARRSYDRLMERFAAVEERRAELLMMLGTDKAAVAFTRELVDRHPYREQRWALLMLALYRSGRRRDALGVFGQARRRFLEEIGIEPGPMLRRLEAQVVADDPRLMSSSPVLQVMSSRLAPDEAEIFVGRTGELLALTENLERVQTQKTPRLVDLSGEPGIGKTALVTAFIASVSDWLERTIVLVGHCDADQALHPVTHALMSVAPIDLVRTTANADVDPAALAAVLPDLVDRPAPATADVTRDRIEDAVVRVLRELGRFGQLVVVFEDLHWATPRLGRLIERILDGDAGHPLLLTTRRDTETIERPILDVLERADAAGRVDRLAVGPLSEAALDEYLSEVFGPSTERTQLAAWLQTRTEGNPLFVRELVHHLVATNAVEIEGSRVSLRGDIGPLPDSLRTAIAERVASMSAPTVATLQVVAAAGNSCDLDLLEVLAGDVSFAIHEAQRARVIVAPDTPPGAAEGASVMLAHDLVRRFLYDLMPEPRRVEMHERIGGSLIALGGAPSDIAHHYRAAATLDSRRALEWTVRAGRDADANFDHDAAVLQFAAARVFVERGSVEDIELAIAEGAARRRAGDADHVECLLGAAEEARALGDGSLLARAMIEVGDLGGATQAGSTDERVRPLLEDALTMVRDPVLDARLRAAVSVFFSLSEQWPRVRELWESAAAAAEAIGDERLLLAVYQAADHGTGAPNQLDRRREVSTRLANLAARHHDANGSYIADYLAYTAALHAGTAAEIDDRLARLVRFDRDVAHGAKAWTVTFSRAGRAHLAGRLQEAEALNDLALSLGTGMARSWTFAVYSGILIGIRNDQDRLDELRGDVSALVKAQPGMRAWRSVAAYIAADVGDHDAAARHLADVVDSDHIHLPDDMTWPAAAIMLGAVAVTLGDRERGATIARALAPYSGRSACSGPCVFGTIDASLGDLALLASDRSCAATHYRRARDVAERLGAPILRAEADARLAALAPDAAGVEALTRISAEAEQRGWHRLARRSRLALTPL